MEALYGAELPGGRGIGRAIQANIFRKRVGIVFQPFIRVQIEKGFR